MHQNHKVPKVSCACIFQNARCRFSDVVIAVQTNHDVRSVVLKPVFYMQLTFCSLNANTVKRFIKQESKATFHALILNDNYFTNTHADSNM